MIKEKFNLKATSTSFILCMQISSRHNSPCRIHHYRTSSVM